MTLQGHFDTVVSMKITFEGGEKAISAGRDKKLQECIIKQVNYSLEQK